MTVFGFVRRKVLYPSHWHIADRLHKSCAWGHFCDHLARSAPVQGGYRSIHAFETHIGFGIHMGIGRIDQDPPMPVDILECLGHVHPIRGEDDDIAFSGLPLRTSRCAWAEIGDEACQRLRPSRIGYDNRMTGVDEVTPESLGQSSGAYEAYSHDGVPVWTWRWPVLSRRDSWRGCCGRTDIGAELLDCGFTRGAGARSAGQDDLDVLDPDPGQDLAKIAADLVVFLHRRTRAEVAAACQDDRGLLTGEQADIVRRHRHADPNDLVDIGLEDRGDR